MKSLSAGPYEKFSLLWFQTHLHKTNEQNQAVEHVSIFHSDQEKDGKEHKEKPTKSASWDVHFKSQKLSGIKVCSSKPLT